MKNLAELRPQSWSIAGSNLKMAAKTTDMSFVPTDWEDDDRMNFMFSAFPENRNVNPKHWDSKLNFWTTAVCEMCQSRGEFCTDLNTLRQRFTRNGHVPLGLKIVLREMLRTQKLQTVEDIQSHVNDDWLSWSYGYMRKSFSWTVGTMLWGGNESDRILDNQNFVLTQELQEKADLLLKMHHKAVEHEATDHVVPWNVLKMRCSSAGLLFSDMHLEIVLCHLQRQRMVFVHSTKEGEKVIKFCKKNQSKVVVITDTDLDIMRLKKMVAVLTLQVKKLSKNIESCREKAKECVNQGLRKSKESYQKSLDRTTGSLLTLEELLHRIQESETDKRIVETLKSGSSALRAIQEGMNASDVDKVLMDVEGTLEDAENIQQSLAQGNKAISDQTGGDDMEELERELEALSLSVKAQEEPEEKFKNSLGAETRLPQYHAMDDNALFGTQLPSVPLHSPTSSSSNITTVQKKAALLAE
ncbi:charged multivesicular body protein 7 isoform X2 [Nematostella vectensis]|uniref:charged multivesicular body protein 7 isoform X2 n=1 Tax=Nematostella vectensis TaxID=45351 RepID=UPI0020773873|nr:charged multivesicular body protein 7 isoform X2 [Nematostella vectensis]